jgi:hypothetical protein
MPDGETFDPERDGERLALQLKAVRRAMSDHKWHTLYGLSIATGAPEASASARLRDLRKPNHGSNIIERRYVNNGLWEYRMARPGDWTETPRNAR